MPNLGPMELLVILGIALLLFGNRLPTVGKSLGEGIRNFKKGLNDDSGDKAQPQAQQPQQNTQSTQQTIAAQSVQPGSLQSPQVNQQTKVDFVDVEHRDSSK
ncbi:twin-arginine translocase TatA/TatE family subunit [bacterium]|nr:twin-arginine translocase TatA/TatE family subunit [bacterium]